MGANKGRQAARARQSRSILLNRKTWITLALASIASPFSAVALDLGGEDGDDNQAQEVQEETSTDTGSASTGREGWLGFGRSALKPGNFLYSTTAETTTASDFARGGGSGRLENNSGNTAFFNTGGFGERGRYQIVPGWSVTPGFELRETYTDNVALKSKNGALPPKAPADASDDFVTELDPSIRLFGDQRRIKFQLRYVAQSLIYAKNTELSDVRHRLFSAAQAELFPRLFYFDGSTSITQQNTFSGGRGVTSNFGPGAFLGGASDNINFVGDRTDIFTYSLSPYLRKRLQNIAVVELRYMYSEYAPIRETDDQLSNFGSSMSRGYRGQLESGEMFNRFKWRLAYDRRSTGFSSGSVIGQAQSGSTSLFEKYFAQLEYALVPRFSVLGTVGYENNRFAQSAQFTNPPRGVIWDVGGRWAPTNRTNLQATYGKRFYGDRYFFDLSHRMQHALFGVKYTEEPNLGSLQSLQVINEGSAGDSSTPTTNSVSGAVLTNPSAGVADPCNQNVYVRKLLSAAMTYTGVRNDVTLQFYREERDYRNNSSATGCPGFAGQSSDQNLLGITGLWTHSLTPSTALDTAVTWTDLNANNGNNGIQNNLNVGAPGQVWNLNLNLSHRLSRNLGAYLGFRRIERTANDPNQEYTENRVFGSLRFNY